MFYKAIFDVIIGRFDRVAEGQYMCL